MTNFARLLSLLAATLGIASAATITTYSDRATFLADVSPVTNISFTPALQPPGSGITSYGTAAGLTLSGVNFTGMRGAGYYLYAVSTSYCCAAHNRGDHIEGPSFPNGADPHVRITLPAGTYAAGLDLWSVILGDTAGAMTDTLKLQLDATTYPVKTKAKGDGTGKVFFGFKSDTPIAWFEIRPTGATAYPEMADFVFGGTAPDVGPAGVPEPSSLLLLGVGLLALGFWRRSA